MAWQYTDDDNPLMISQTEEALALARGTRYVLALRLLRDLPIPRYDRLGLGLRADAISALDECCFVEADENAHCAASEAVEKLLEHLRAPSAGKET